MGFLKCILQSRVCVKFAGSCLLGQVFWVTFANWNLLGPVCKESTFKFRGFG